MQNLFKILPKAGSLVFYCFSVNEIYKSVSVGMIKVPVDSPKFAPDIINEQWLLYV